MVFKVQLPSLNQVWVGVTQSEAFKSTATVALAIGLVVISFQGLWAVTMSVFAPQFFLMPLYFVISCAMIILGIQTLERNESTRNR